MSAADLLIFTTQQRTGRLSNSKTMEAATQNVQVELRFKELSAEERARRLRRLRGTIHGIRRRLEQERAEVQQDED